MKLRTLLLLLAVLAVVGALTWGAIRVVRATTATTALELPTTKVKQGRVTLTVTCRGELQGGNSEMLTAPMIGGGDMAITSLREPGELVSPGDVVVQFDTTEQDFKLKEAEADLAEAQQQVIKAEADSLATARPPRTLPIRKPPHPPASPSRRPRKTRPASWPTSPAKISRT